MVDSPADDKEPAQQRTRVRTPADDAVELEPTVPLGRRSPQAPSAPTRPLHRRVHCWLVAATVVTGLVLMLWWQSTDDESAPLPPAPVQQAPATVPVQENALPANEADSNYRQRLLALSSLPPPTLSESEREQRLSDLFEHFSRAIDSGNLDLPATDSAAEYLLRMMSHGTDHPRVLEARSRLAQAFLEESRRARLAGDWDEADRWLQRAVEIRLDLGAPGAETGAPD